MEKQRKTFLSYSRVNKDFAVRLAKELKAEGFDIWLDQLDIEPGAWWDDEVERALEECEIFMVIITPSSSASKNVKDEIGYALDTSKRILPILLENATLPLRLRRLQYVDFTGKGFDEGVEAAKELLRRLISQPTVPRIDLSDDQRQQLTQAEAGRKVTEEPDSLAAQEAEDERAAKQKVEEGLAAKAKAEQDRKAQEEGHRLAPQKAEEERLARQKAEQERLAKQKAKEERAVKAKAEKERLAKIEAERKAEADHFASQRAEEIRLTQRKIEEERTAKAQQEADRIAAQKSEEERLAKEKADEKHLAIAQAEAERLTTQQADEAHTARAKAETERRAKEEAHLASQDTQKESITQQRALEGTAEQVPPAKSPVEHKTKVEGRRKTKETVTPTTAQELDAGSDNTQKEQIIHMLPAAPSASPATVSTPQKKAGPRVMLFGIATIAVLVIAGIGFKAIFNNQSPVAEETVATAVPTSKPVKTSTPRPNPTSTPRPSATPNTAATQKVLDFTATAKSAEALAAQAIQWNLKISERFDNTSNPYGWYTGTDISEYGKGEARITNGKYIWSYDAKQGVFFRSWVYTISLTDFYLTVDATETSGCSACSFGIVFRNSVSNDYYYFGISSEQKQYFFYLYQGEWTTLIDRTSSSVIRSEGPNKLSIIAQGPHFMFFINNQYVAEITDDTLPNGPMGLGIELNADYQGEFEFDDVELRVP